MNPAINYDGLAPGLADHVFVVILIIVFPLLIGVLGLVRAWRRRDDGEDELARTARLAAERSAAYRRTAIWLIIIASAVLGLWFFNGRPPESIGLALGREPHTTVAAIALGVLFLLQLATILTLPFRKALSEKTARDLQAAAPILPQTFSEYGFTLLLSIIAGITEEIVYRGYLIWYFSTFGGVFYGVFAAALVFAAAHAYQGPRGMVKVGIAALGFSGLYLITGSLLLPILAHILIDMLSFTAAFIVLRRASVRREVLG